MKTLNNYIKTLLLSVTTLIILSVPKESYAQPGISISFQQFYDELSPYGQWVDDPDYGYIWIPDVEPGFQPYATNGYWVMTDYGNTWVSNYQWGWAPFHYGRWNHHNRYGWYWVPDYEWGPAWVSWRSGGGYYGWAPLTPGVSIGVSINLPVNFWVFVPQRYILNSRINRYYAPRTTIVNVYQHTTIINNTYRHNSRTYITGPRRTEIQRVTRTSVPVRKIATTTRPGTARVSSRSVEIYRPNVTRNTQARPARVNTADNIRPSAGRTNATRGTSGTTSSTRQQTTTPSTRPANTTRTSPARTNTNNKEVTRPATRSNTGSTTRPAATRPASSKRSNIQPQTSVQRPSTPSRSTVQRSSTTNSSRAAAPARNGSARSGRSTRNN